MRTTQLTRFWMAAFAMLVPLAVGSCSRTPMNAEVSGRPACAPPTARLATASQDLAVKSGTKATLAATVQDTDGSHMLSGILVVAKPGSTAAADNPADRPTTSAALAANQLATATLTQAAAGGMTAEVSYDTHATGVYPIVLLGSYQRTSDCSARSEVLPTTTVFATILGDLRVG